MRTLALYRSGGKSFVFSVTMNLALPCSAQRQNGSSFGSGEISTKERTLTSSARSRIRLTARPIKWERTRRRFRASLYSHRISSVTSHTKLLSIAHLWSKSALGFLPGTYGFLKPAMPATRTLVSTTTRGLRFLSLGGNGDLRCASLSTIPPNCPQYFLFGNLSNVLCCFR